MYIIIKMIHYFRNSSIDNQTGKSNINTRKKELKQTVKEPKIGSRTVPHNIPNQMTPQNISFARSKSTVNRGIEKHQYAGNFIYSRLILYFNLFSCHQNFV